MTPPPTGPPVDLRSDTVTRPDARMREAMARAEVGDDVLDGDPTMRALAEEVAGLLGTEGALWVPSAIGHKHGWRQHRRRPKSSASGCRSRSFVTWRRCSHAWGAVDTVTRLADYDSVGPIRRCDPHVR